MRELPPSWCWSRFDAVANVAANLVSPADHRDLPHIAPNHIESASGHLLPYRTIREDGVTSAKHHFFPGQILYSKIRPYLAKTVVVDFTGLCSADMYPIVTDLHARFLWRWLLTPEFTERASRSQGRTVLPKLNQKSLGAQWVPVAPLNEQHRIVKKLDTLMAHSRRAKESLDAIPPLLEKYKKAVLAAAFRGDLTKEWRAQNPDVEPASVLLERIKKERRARWEEDYLAKQRAKGKEPKNDKWKAKYKEPEPVDTSGLPELPQGWCWTALNELRDLEPNSMTDGPFGSKLKTAHYVESGVRVVRLGNLGVGEFKDHKKSFITEDHYSSISKHAVHEGDLVIAALAEPVGRACVLPDIGPAIVKADCIRFKPVAGMDASLIMHWLNSGTGSQVCEELSHGIGRLRINMENMRRVPVPVPPVPEQSVLRERCNDALSAIAHSSTLIAAQQQNMGSLNRAILAKAFRGELVPQDPNDEPAELLLARIKKEREEEAARLAAEKKAKRAKKKPAKKRATRAKRKT